MIAVMYERDADLWVEYADPVGYAKAMTTGEVLETFEGVARKCSDDGLHAVGWLSYGASPGFDPKLSVRETPNSSFPLSYFAFFARLKEYRSLTDVPGFGEWSGGGYSISAFNPEISRERYLSGVDSIREYLARGDSYQVNYTFMLSARFSGCPREWFRTVAERKPGAYLAYIETDEYSICSFSPELFFGKRNDAYKFKPMKGTASIPPEGLGTDALEAARTALARSEKNRAENLMIVDMIRNDAGRLAAPGSVCVPRLFETEAFPTVIQMTSTVTARIPSEVPAAMTALFPCASITGAPKIRSMEIIRELETCDRGLYTGAIGRLYPGGDCDFSVAIRTAVIDNLERTVTYGCGSGIVWESSPEDEWDECLAKTAILRGEDPFVVFESFLIEDGVAFLPDRHLSRLLNSCRFFGFDAIPEALCARWTALLSELRRDRPNGSHKAKVTFDGNDMKLADVSPAGTLPLPYTVRVAESRVDPADPFVGHKTNRRRHIERALESARGACDVLLVNSRGELTETSRGNLLVGFEGRLYTPPVGSGILPGVYREELIERGLIEERVLYPEELARAEGIYMINSVRRRVPCLMI